MYVLGWKSLKKSPVQNKTFQSSLSNSIVYSDYFCGDYNLIITKLSHVGRNIFYPCI